MKHSFKTNFVVLVTLLALILSATSASAAGAWQAVGSAGFSAGTADEVTLALDSNNVPYVAFQDGANSGKATVMKFEGGAWQIVGSAGFSAGRSDHITFALDSNNVPYVAYTDVYYSEKATVMKFEGGSWQLVGSAGFSPGLAGDLALALDSNNVPYVAYNDYANSNKATVMKFEGGSWQAVGSAGFSAGTAGFPSLAVDSNDVPYVVFQDGNNSSKATVMKFEGGSWQTVGSAGFSAGYASDLSLALDSNNVPYVAYTDFGNSRKTTVMKFESGSWQTVGSAGFSAGTVGSTSLALDSNNTPYVAYRDGANANKATAMVFAGGSWQSVGSAGFTTGYASYTSLALDSNNTPYVAYQDGGNSFKATVMKYFSDAAPTVGAVSLETLQNRRVSANLSDLGIPASVSAYGVVFNTTGSPTTSDSKVDKGNTTTTGIYEIGLDELALTAGTKYYVRAFATNATGTSYGAELEVYGAPGTFTVTAPANNATDVSTSPTLSWTASTGATDYQYCVAVDINDCVSNFTGPNWHSTSGATSANLSSLSPNTTYLWGVRASVGSPASYTWGTNSGPYSFTTAAGPVNHTVTFDANGGTGSMSDQTASSSTALTNNAFTRTGYSFAGWNTAADGSGTAYANSATYDFSADITLYAQWTAMPNRLVLPANASQDGWILESSETSETGRTINSTSTVLMVGDDASDRQYRSVISFDTSSLPDTAVITQAMLSFRINEIVGGGNPIKAFNYFIADVTSSWFGSTSSLAAHDFAFSPTLSSGPLNAKNVGGWYYLDLKTGKTAINTTGITQIRLRFNLGDNDNGIANLIKIYSGNSAGKPQLSVWYTIP